MILIHKAQIVNEGRTWMGDVLIEGERIARIAPEIAAPEGAIVVEAEGAYLLPGVIDTHVHFRDGGQAENPAANFESESRAALMGGVTSVIDMPNTTPQTTSLELMERKEERAAACSMVNYGFMLGATNDNIGVLTALDPDRFAAIKLFLGSSTGNMLVNDAKQLDRLFAESRKLIVAHCEEESIVQANMRNYKMECQGSDRETAALHPQVRSTEACYVSTYKAVERARKFGTHLHVAHISSATELDLFSNFDLGKKHITAEVTPNHLWFDARDYDRLGNLIKCNPSIKSNDDRLALWAALYDGRIDTIATDHAPHPWSNKMKRYFDAPSGIPSIRYSLSMMVEPFFSSLLSGKELEELTQTWMPLLVAKMCHNPATLFGIEKRGFIREGFAADLTLVQPCAEGWMVPTNPEHTCEDPAAPWSPLAGETFHSRIAKVFVNGALAYDADQPDNLAKNAQLLTYHTPNN